MSPRKPACSIPGVRYGTGCTWVDYDRDGKLDLFVSHYMVFDYDKMPARGRMPRCNSGALRSIAFLAIDRRIRAGLYHNNGDGTFTDVSEKAGILGVKPGLWPDRRGRRFRRRRLARYLRRVRFHAQPALPQQPRRHVQGNGPGMRSRAERGRPGASRHGRGHRRYQCGRQPGYHQDPLPRRHSGALSRERQGLIP